MADGSDSSNRRHFLKAAAMSACGLLLGAGPARSENDGGGVLQVWSCGGLAEAMMPLNDRFQAATGTQVAYTGAFAAALGKSLLGSASTDVFAGRVLDLAKKLRAKDKMSWFVPLCFTRYVLVTPKGNPGGVKGIEDLARPGVRVVLAPEASPPGGAAALKILEKAGIQEAALKNAVTKGSCVQRTMDDIVGGKGHASIVELRLTRLPAFAGKVEVLDIDEGLFPPGPLTFTAGVMKKAANPALAERYVKHLTSAEGQASFERFGFISASSDKGRQLIEKLGVKDV